MDCKILVVKEQVEAIKNKLESLAFHSPEPIVSEDESPPGLSSIFYKDIGDGSSFMAEAMRVGAVMCMEA